MKRMKWSVKVLNQLGNLAMECDSAAAIEEARATAAERQALQQKLRDVRFWLEKHME